MNRAAAFLAPSCLLAGLLLASGLASAGTEPAAIKSIELLPEKDGLPAGGSMRIALSVTLSREFHVNSHVPSSEYLIPTSVEVVSLDGLKAGGWEFPEGVERKLPFSEEPLRIYDGTFRILGELKAAPDTPASPRQVRLALKYQACTAVRCYPPRKEEASLSVRIVPAGSPVKSLHDEIFAARSADRSGSR